MDKLQITAELTQGCNTNKMTIFIKDNQERHGSSIRINKSNKKEVGQVTLGYGMMFPSSHEQNPAWNILKTI